MSLSAIQGQEEAVTLLLNGLRSERTSHAYIFHGPSGTPRKEAALGLAAAVLCESKLDGDACGSCLSCRKVQSGNQESITIIEPDGASIKIEQIRELQKQFSYRARSKASIYMIEQADRMTPPAANSLLKFLEEPGQRLIAILITDNGYALLPTIRSRAQWVSFVPMSPERMTAVLLQEGHPETLVRAAVRISSGLEQARELIQLNWFAEIRSIVIQLAQESLSGSSAAIVTAHAGVFKAEHGEHVDTLFDLFTLLFKDMILIQNGAKQSLVFYDQANWMVKQAFAKPVASWVKAMEAGLEAKKRLRFHVNAQLVLEQFVVTLQGGL